MAYLALKAVLTGMIVAAVSEIAKRSSALAAILASLPLMSILAIVWLYVDTKDTAAVRSLSTGIFWMVILSLFFFVVFPLLLKSGLRFYPALTCSSLAMVGVYWAYAQILGRFGIRL